MFSVETKGFSINGMNNSLQDAQKNGQLLANVVQKPIEIHYNGVSDPQRIRQTIGEAASCGILAPAYMLDRFREIQNEKAWSAYNLALKVCLHLDKTPYGAVALFSHSQGADIAKMAQAMCGKSRWGRIRIVNLGGKSEIAGAKNFAHNKDWISWVSRCWNGSTHQSQMIDSPTCQTFMCHGVPDYLSNPQVVAWARRAMEPTVLVPTIASHPHFKTTCQGPQGIPHR